MRFGPTPLLLVLLGFAPSSPDGVHEPLWITMAVEDDPFVALCDTFDLGPADPTLRTDPWQLYKPAAIGTATVGAGALLLEPTEGGPGIAGSLWFSPGPHAEHDGMLVYKPVGPSAGTPIGFDARARLAVWSGQGAVADEFRYAVLAVHDPDRTHLNYVHVGVGWDPAGANVETKTTDHDGVAGASAYAVSPVGPLEIDVRLVRRSSDVQRFDTYFRPTSPGQALRSDQGWTLHHTVDRSDGDAAADTMPPRPAAAPLPDDVHLGVSVYANSLDHDIVAEVRELWVGQTSA